MVEPTGSPLRHGSAYPKGHTKTQPLTILGGDAPFGDRFESGDTSRWSALVS
jgi:hypothetical protein